jgi:hypothetical protein
LSIVVEFSADALLGKDRPDLWVAAAEVVSRGTPAARFERIGRPEVKNVLLSINGNDPENAQVDLRDLYNLEDPFAVDNEVGASFRTRINANLTLLDALDGDTAWLVGDDGQHPLIDMILNDHLVLDTRMPFAERSYFDVERALLDGGSHATCGGRWLNDDVIDTLYTLYVSGLHGQPVSDGVDGPSAPASQTFPYLQPPNAHPPKPDPGVPTAVTTAASRQ